MSSSTFGSNISGDDGGAIYNTTGSLTVTNSMFTNNNATGDDGGAIYDNSDSSNSANDSCFSGNTANDDGDAIYRRSGSFDAEDNYWGRADGATSAMINWRVDATPYRSSCPN
ncbi:MAG: hypothetical protein HND48_20550 [Chloroflexi bacterium]|nr:hypothetical protein [Chloroflexota bacterium]